MEPDTFGLDTRARTAAENRLARETAAPQVLALDPPYPYRVESISPLFFEE